jgi:hypothetical protein
VLLFACPRFLLAKDGLLTAVWGLWFLATIRFRRPTAFVMARPFMEGRHAFSADPKMILRCAGGSGPLPVMWLGPAGGGRRRAEAGGQAAGWRVTVWPRASSLAMSRRVSRSGSRRRVK